MDITTLIHLQRAAIEEMVDKTLAVGEAKNIFIRTLSGKTESGIYYTIDLSKEKEPGNQEEQGESIITRDLFKPDTRCGDIKKNE